jgi:hypothetical protein
MAQEHVISREYKLMLRAHLFTGTEDELLRKAGAFWRAFTQVIRDVVFDTDGDLDEIAKRRFIRFYDTKGHRLQKNDYIFRERVDIVSGEREVTLKFRHPDRYVAQDRNMAAAEVKRGKAKFEEDIKPPCQSLYSYSTTQQIADDKKLNQMNDPGRLYPGLPEQLHSYDEDEAITVVGAFTARELVLTGADFQIGKEPKVEAECAFIVWYDVQGEAQIPEVVEFSFRYSNDDGQYAGAVAKRAYDVFQLLQGEALASWVDHASKTKTAYIYS